MHTKFISEVFSKAICAMTLHILTYSVYLIRCQLGGVYSQFGGAVGHVIRVGAYKQVGGVDASGIVALMKGVKLFRYWAICKFPSKSMGKHHSSSRSTDSEAPISLVINLCTPEPTGGSFVHLAPKSRFNVWVESWHTTIISQLAATHVPFLNG